VLAQRAASEGPRWTRARKDNLPSLTAEVDGKKGIENLAEYEGDEEGVARCPSCSQNAHIQKVLVRCAQ
jgi:hypothetical protein